MEAQDRPGTDGVRREDAETEVPTTFPTTSSQDVLMSGTFLLQHIDDLDWSDLKELEREWHGHVVPAIARFRMALAGLPESATRAYVIRLLAPNAGQAYLQYRSRIGDNGSRLDAWMAGVEWVISDPDFAI